MVSELNRQNKNNCYIALGESGIVYKKDKKERSSIGEIYKALLKSSCDQNTLSALEQLRTKLTAHYSHPSRIKRIRVILLSVFGNLFKGHGAKTSLQLLEEAITIVKAKMDPSTHTNSNSSLTSLKAQNSTDPVILQLNKWNDENLSPDENPVLAYNQIREAFKSSSASLTLNVPQVKSLPPLEGFTKLAILDITQTTVKQITSPLPAGLKTLRVNSSFRHTESEQFIPRGCKVDYLIN